MTTPHPFDPSAPFRPDIKAAAPYAGKPLYRFVGGNKSYDSVPVAGLTEAMASVLQRDGEKLAIYNLDGNPLGYEPLREYVSAMLLARAATVADPGNVLITSGSLQALDLVNQLFTQPGDTVLVEQATYGGMLSRLRSIGVGYQGVALDNNGIEPDHLDQVVTSLSREGRKPKYLYTIPTVQNPTGSVMPTERRREILEIARLHDLLIFEDDCYADLLWEGERPPTFRALDLADQDGSEGPEHASRVVYCGSFSKSIAPALRVGFVVADWEVLSRMLSLKVDAGSGALEQMVLAEYCTHYFDQHVAQLLPDLRAKSDALLAASEQHFGEMVTITPPKGGIYSWLEFPNHINTSTYVDAASALGVQFNPGAEWSADAKWGASRMRLCFGEASIEEIDRGVAALASVFPR